MTHPLEVRELEYDELVLKDPIHVQTVTGLIGLPDLRSSDRALLGRHGERAGLDRLGGRTVTLELEVVAFDEPTFTAAIEDVAAAFAIRDSEDQELPLRFRLPGVAGGNVGRIYARPRRMATAIDATYWNYAATVSVELRATDPRIYADTESSGATYLAANVTTGLTYPLVYGRTYGVVGPDGRIQVVNAGNFPAQWVARIEGPVLNPSVRRSDTGEWIKLNLDIAAGDHVVLDSFNRTILLNGLASRYNALDSSSRWWTLPAGLTEVTFQADSATDARLYLYWRSTWQ